MDQESKKKSPAPVRSEKAEMSLCHTGILVLRDRYLSNPNYGVHMV